MQSPVDISVLILAGGKSSRMGQDNALMDFQGRSLLQRVYDAAAQCCPRIYIATHQPQVYQPLLPQSSLWISETPHEGDRPFQGPLIGFARALPHIPSAWILLLACDLPFLEVETLRQWIQQAAGNPLPCIACVPRIRTRWEPLCALYHTSCRESLQAFVDAGGRSFQRWLDGQPVQPLTVPNPKMLYNCNTQNDFIDGQQIGL